MHFEVCVVPIASKPSSVPQCHGSSEVRHAGRNATQVEVLGMGRGERKRVGESGIEHHALQFVVGEGSIHGESLTNLA